MKSIKNWNTFAIGLPITLGFIGLANNEIWFFAGLSLMLTGFIQVIIGLKLLFNNPANSYLKIYASSVGLFFMTWMINVGLDYIDIITYLLIPIPFILLFYLTIIIHKIKN